MMPLPTLTQKVGLLGDFACIHVGVLFECLVARASRLHVPCHLRVI